MKNQCQKCGRSFKTLTKEGLCAYCHCDEHEDWPKEFSDETRQKA